MSLLILVCVVILVLVLVMWAIYYLPMPPGVPPWSKNILYVVAILVAVVVILARSGVINA